MLPIYQFCRLNRSGVIDTKEAASLNDDQSALLYATNLQHTDGVEIWHGRRKVGLVPPDRRPHTPSVDSSMRHDRYAAARGLGLSRHRHR